MKRTPLRRRSLKRARADRKLAKARQVVIDRADWRCEALTPVCCGIGSAAHHRLRRSQGGPDTPENLLWVCAPCHTWIHDHPAASVERGLLLRGVA